MKIRPLHLLLAVPLFLLLAVVAWEFGWRAGHDLLKPPAEAPDGERVAEVRALPGPHGPEGAETGVYLRTRWQWLRSVQPRLVFTGACDEVSTRWFGERRLVIECQLRGGQPRLLEGLIDGVVIEVVVQRQYG